LFETSPAVYVFLFWKMGKSHFFQLFCAHLGPQPSCRAVYSPSYHVTTTWVGISSGLDFFASPPSVSVLLAFFFRSAPSAHLLFLSTFDYNLRELVFFVSAVPTRICFFFLLQAPSCIWRHMIPAPLLLYFESPSHRLHVFYNILIFLIFFSPFPVSFGYGTSFYVSFRLPMI